MSDKLDKYIEKNISYFDSEELPIGHKNRFEQRLKEKDRTKNVIKYISLAVVSTAAIFILFFMPMQAENRDDSALISDVNLYYGMRIDELISQINQKTTNLTLEEKIQIEKYIEDFKKGEQELMVNRDFLDKKQYLAILVELKISQQESLEDLATLLTNNY